MWVVGGWWQRGSTGPASRQRAGFLGPQRYHGSPKRALAKLLTSIEGLHELQPIFRTKFSGHEFLAPK